MKKMWKDSFEVRSSKLKVQSWFKLRIKSKEQGWKRPVQFSVFILCSLFFTLLMSCQNKSNSDKKMVLDTKYTCPMHPQIMEDKPGSCPICGMDLVPLHQHAVKMEVDADLADLIEPTNEVVTGNVKTIVIKQSAVRDTIRANGVVNYNSNNLKTVSSRVSGRIEKLYVKFNFEKVYKGQKIMEIYSPDLAAAQQELLYLKANHDATLLAQAKTKLRLLGVSEKQINLVLVTGKVNYSIPVYSDFSGYLLDAGAASSNLNQNPKNPSALNTENNSISLVEGQYVKTGDLLFKLFNDNEVWAEFYVDANQMSLIHQGDAVKILKGDEMKNARINLIQPYYSDGQNYGVLRIYLQNAQKNFKIGELLKMDFPLPEQQGLWVPAAAVYQLGNKYIVFLKVNNVLKPKEVLVYQKSAGSYLIKNGLKEGDEIAQSASYLMDTQSFIKIN